MKKGLKHDCQTLEEAASSLLSAAVKAGAEAAEVCGSFVQKSRVSLEKQDFHIATSDQGYELGLRVITNEKQGFASCNSTDPRELKEIALRAVEISGFSPRNALQVIGPTENLPKDSPVELWDDALFSLSLQTQKEWAQLLARSAMRDPRLRLTEASVEIGSGLYLVMSSKGTHKLSRETAATWSLMGMAVDGDNITSFDYFNELSRRAATVGERIASSTHEFCDQLFQALRTGPAKSYRGAVVFSPRAVVEVLLSGLAYHLNGRNVAEATSRWKPADLGATPLSPLVSLRDSAWLTDRQGCAAFDREGTPTQSLTLFESGTLRSFLLDTYAAGALGMKSTGNAAGGPASLPTVSPHCLVMAPGSRDRAELFSSMNGDFLLVNRFSGSVDPVSGDFSGVAKGAEWWSRGERAYGVKETLISGNLFEALGSALVGLSRETRVIHSHHESPWCLADGVSVTAG